MIVTDWQSIYKHNCRAERPYPRSVCPKEASTKRWSAVCRVICLRLDVWVKNRAEVTEKMAFAEAGFSQRRWSFVEKRFVKRESSSRASLSSEALQTDQSFARHSHQRRHLWVIADLSWHRARIEEKKGAVNIPCRRAPSKRKMLLGITFNFTVRTRTAIKQDGAWLTGPQAEPGPTADAR